jgi:hypothetical protein
VTICGLFRLTGQLRLSITVQVVILKVRGRPTLDISDMRLNMFIRNIK